MAGQSDYEKLLAKYAYMSQPLAQITLGGEKLALEKEDMVVGEAHVELTSGYEASVASFRLYDVMDNDGHFKYKLLKNLELGAPVTISLGYNNICDDVFKGFVTTIAFAYSSGDLPCIEVSAMDIKGLMMGGSYAAQLEATNYSDAVEEVIKRTAQKALNEKMGLTALSIKKRPDSAKQGAPQQVGSSKAASDSVTMEMVAESDYEFVVRAAKRYNFEFFVLNGKVIFRPAKAGAGLLMQMSTREGINYFNIDYTIAGLVKAIETRAMDPDQGKLFKAQWKLNDQALTKKALDLVGSATKVVLDPSIHSEEDAQFRVNTLQEAMRYHIGSLEADCVGLPNLVPGSFIMVDGMGDPVDNKFYLTKVVHDISGEKGFSTHIEGCAESVGKKKEAQGAPPALGV